MSTVPITHRTSLFRAVYHKTETHCLKLSTLYSRPSVVSRRYRAEGDWGNREWTRRYANESAEILASIRGPYASARVTHPSRPSSSRIAFFRVHRCSQKHISTTNEHESTRIETYVCIGVHSRFVRVVDWHGAEAQRAEGGAAALICPAGIPPQVDKRTLLPESPAGTNTLHAGKTTFKAATEHPTG